MAAIDIRSGLGSSLLCRNWVATLKLQWENVFPTEKADRVQEDKNTFLNLLTRYQELFREEL